MAKNVLRCACWNILTWKDKEAEILLEMKEHNIDICALSETKRKGKGDSTYPGYILLYSGPEKHKRATAGVGMLVTEKLKHDIEDTSYVNERILRVALKVGKEIIQFISVYAPDNGKSKEETDNFYGNLEAELEKIPKDHKVSIMGDLNARIGSVAVDGIKQRFNEQHINENGQTLIDSCTHNELRVNNTYFDHKLQQKITWSNTRGQTSMIDYVITNTRPPVTSHRCKIPYFSKYRIGP